jgi:glycosyltransferase involved in cell wall biosynthesis
MVKRNNLNIYGTVFNNAEYIEACISSIKLLAKDRKIALWVVDNYSTDGTIDKLMEMSKNKEYTKYIDFHIYQAKCSRGRGRQIALDYAIRYSYSPNDLAMYIDFDTIYTKKYVELINKIIPIIQDGEVYINIIGMLATINTNKLVSWRNLNVGEDTERGAHFVSKGVKLIAKIPFSATNGTDYALNRDVNKKFWSERERTYGGILRIINGLIEEHRGVAYKNFTGDCIHTKCKIASFFAHIIASIKGVYSYDKKLNNKELIWRATTTT